MLRLFGGAHPLLPTVSTVAHSGEALGMNAELTAQRAVSGQGQAQMQALEQSRMASSNRLRLDSHRFTQFNEDECYRFLRDLATSDRVQNTEFAEMFARSQGFRSMAGAIDRLQIDTKTFSDEEGNMATITNNRHNGIYRFNHWIRSRSSEMLTGGLALGAFAVVAPPVAAAFGLAAAVPALGTAAASVIGGSFGSWMGELYRNYKLYGGEATGESVATKAAGLMTRRLLGAKKMAQTMLLEIETTPPPINRELIIEKMSLLTQKIIHENCHKMFDEVVEFWKVDKNGRIWQAIGSGVGSFAAGALAQPVYQSVSNMIQAKSYGSYTMGKQTFTMVNNMWHATTPQGFGGVPGQMFRHEFLQQLSTNSTLASAATSTAVLAGRDAGSGIWGAANKYRRWRGGRREMGVIAGSYGDYIATPAAAAPVAAAPAVPAGPPPPAAPAGPPPPAAPAPHHP